jgi:phosphoribosylglycinamide formyltransferase-1
LSKEEGPGRPSLRVAVLVSGSGSNLEAILQAMEAGQLPGVNVVLVISSRADAYALERARRHKVTALAIDSRQFASDAAFQEAVLSSLMEAQIDVICLAGYLKLVGPEIIRRYVGRILNIHPALLPKYGGPGMYGHHVHEVVLRSGDQESGCTVHVVDEKFDHGPILAQVRVPVMPGDTAESLAQRILEQEHKLYPQTLRQFCERLLAAPSKGPTP